MKLRRVGVAALAGLVVAGAATAGIIIIISAYYRWPSAPGTNCEAPGAGVEIHLDTQPREWAFIGPEHQARNRYFTNGNEFQGPAFDPPTGSGSQTYAGFGDSTDAFPFHYEFRLETLSDSQPIYESALAATCTGVGSTTSVIVNWIPGQATSYYRHAYAPPVECTTDGPSVQLRFDSRGVEWKNLPAGATYDIVRLKNGIETPTGPFDLPEGDGSEGFAPLATLAPSYPIHYATRYDTVVSGNVVYQSVLLGSCTADGAGTSRVFNVPEPDGAALALGALAGLAGVAARRQAIRVASPTA
jgi:hypothetical protein